VWAVQSAVELERLGIPSVAVATEAFAEMGQDTARSLGLVGLPLLAADHGFEGLGRAGVRAVAEQLYPEIVRALTANPAELEPDFGSRVWMPSEKAINAACSIEAYAHT